MLSWVVLHCNRRIGAGERRQLITHALSGSISGAGKSIEIRLRIEVFVLGLQKRKVWFQ